MSGLSRMPLALLRQLEPEAAHRMTLRLLRASRFGPRALLGYSSQCSDPILHARALGLEFRNPIGLAAGFDKNAEVMAPMLRLGFGLVEVGSITPRPQEGNPRPRLFRLAEDRAVINRLGFNNAGLEAAAARLERRGIGPGVVGVNLGANKDSADRIGDYVTGLRRLGPLADYVTVNVSSPNTPGLRDLQAAAALDELLGRLVAARQDLERPVPLVLKIAPDLSGEELAGVAEAALRHGIEGLIVGNTTLKARGGLRSAARGESGGLSGAPLFEPSTRLLAETYRLTGGRIALIGTGGIASGAEAYAKIRAGASLVQLYTALIYQGPGLVGRIARDLAALLRRDGFTSVADAVGVSHDKP